MKSKVLIYIIVVLLGFGVGFTVFKLWNKPASETEQPLNRFNRAPGRGFNRLANELRLDDAQKKLFEDYESDYRQQILLLNDEVRALNFQIIQELSSEDPDTVMLFSLSRETGLVHEKIKNTTISHFMNLRSICSTEQALRLSGVFGQIEPMPQRMRNRRGEGRMEYQRPPVNRRY